MKVLGSALSGLQDGQTARSVSVLERDRKAHILVDQSIRGDSNGH